MAKSDRQGRPGTVTATMAARLPAARRRRQLLDVALEVFAANGFHATSMDQIAESAGVTKPVLYQHFGSKRKLYLELLEDVGAQLSEAIAKATARADGPHQQVLAGFRTYFRFVDDHNSAFTLLFGSGARRDEEFAEAVRKVEDAIAELVVPLIEADIDDEHRRLLAHGLVGLAEGVSRHWVAHDMGLDPDVQARRVGELAWAGLRGVRRDVEATD
jgi:AcrR family transcriptional regulator